MIDDYQPLQRELGYFFDDPSLLQEALRHSSYVNEQHDGLLRNNERLEFLGDAVLNLVIGDLLMRAHQDLREGDLSRLRANLVNERQLAEIARDIGVGDYILLGKGEFLSDGRRKNSILANTLEAIMAAVYMDNGFEAAREVIRRHFLKRIAAASDLTADLDYKSRLQEAVQGKIKDVPRYQVVEESGPDHDKTYYVAMKVGAVETRGRGKSKKAAEQDAARQGLEAIQKALKHSEHRTSNIE